MSQSAPSNDRLPWLTEVPRIGTPAPAAKWQFPWGAVLIGLAFAFVALAAYYLGIRKAVESAEPGSRQSLPLEQPYEEPATVAPQEASPEAPSATTPAEAQPSPAPVIVPERPAALQPRRPPAARPRQPARRPAASAAPLPAPVILQPVVRGRIIQLGAYPTPAQAELAWQQLVKKWPYLATKPKLVSPIDVRSTDGKATRMHRLQLATASQAQSVVICQRLEVKKQSCAVVY